MHNDSKDLDFAFPLLPRGENESPRKLRMLLYKGGASVGIKRYEQAIKSGTVGELLTERVELVRLIHEFINAELMGGGSAETARQHIGCITAFYKWADNFSAPLTLGEAQATYLAYAEHLWHRTNVVKDLTEQSAYNYARITGQILDNATERPTPIIEVTRLRCPDPRKAPQGMKADKQKLQETFAFGRLLQDLCDGLRLEIIMGPRPFVSVPLRQGGEIEFSTGQKAQPAANRKKSNIVISVTMALAYEADRTLSHPFRIDMTNLRVQAELLMFIAQTGMNLAQAQSLRLCRFSYVSDINGYRVREYKPRRKGEVLFEIFTEYRAHLERYLEWRRTLFPDENRLFPIIRRYGAREDRRPSFTSIIGACKKAGVRWTPPSMLRGTRVNWILRRSGDPDLAADMAQHHKQTLLTVYEEPSLQRAVSEVTRFHLSNDPAFAGKDLLVSVAPGGCNGTPLPAAEKPPNAPMPDCARPSGCLWCDHHRDIDSLDHVWSLACFRHLKLLELSKYTAKNKDQNVTHPIEHTTKKLSQKLTWFRDSNSVRREWVEESLARVDEGHYHEQWSYLIEAMEGSVN